MAPSGSQLSGGLGLIRGGEKERERERERERNTGRTTVMQTDWKVSGRQKPSKRRD